MPQFPHWKSQILLAVFILSGGFLLFGTVRTAQALYSASNYQKPYNGTLSSSDWNNLLFDNSSNLGYGDFVNTWTTAHLQGPLTIGGYSTTSSVTVNGPIAATNFTTGSLTGTVSATNVSGGFPSAQFGANTGGGSYSFPANVGIGTTNPSQKLEVNGIIQGDSTIYAPSFTSFKQNGTLTNTVITPDTTQIAQSPLAGFLWHDIIAFNKNATPLFETSTDGTTWTTGTLDKRLFDHVEYQNIPMLNAASLKAIRWTWSTGVAWSSAQWLVLAAAYSGTPISVTVSVDSSADGTTWTNRHTSTFTPNANPYWLYVTPFSGDIYLRVTITSNASTGVLDLASLRLLTARWGDQGLGGELSYPYSWDANQQVFFANNVGVGTTNPGTKLDVNGTFRALSATLTGLANASSTVVMADTSGNLFSTSTASFISANGLNLWNGTTGGNIWNANSANVGIGTTVPQAKLEIIKSSTYNLETSEGISVTDGTSDVKISIGADAANNIGYIQSYDPGTSYNTKPLTLQAAGGNTGIGTTTPAGKLDVYFGGGSAQFGSWAGGNNSVFVRSYSGSVNQAVGLYAGGYSGLYSNNALYFGVGSNLIDNAYPGGTISMSIATSSNIGIGNTNPGAKLDVTGSARNSLATTHSLLGGSGNVLVMSDNTGTLYSTSTAAFISANSLNLWSGTTGGNIWNANSGNVGVGITNPGYKLDINGTMHVSGTSTLAGIVPLLVELSTLTNGFNDAGTQALLYRSGGTFSIPNSPWSGNFNGSAQFFGDSNRGFQLAVDSGGSYYSFRNYWYGSWSNWRSVAWSSTSTATTNYLTKFGSNPTSITNSLVYDNGTSVGIATTNPGVTLDVTGSARNSLATTHSLLGGSGNVLVMSDNTGTLYSTSTASFISANSLNLWSGSTTGAIWNANSGNVGIGTTNPVSQLDVASSTNPNLTIRNSNSTVLAGNLIGTLAFRTDDASAITNRNIASISALAEGDYVGTDYAPTSLIFSTHDSGTSGLLERVRITSSGNVGIGTSSPGALLHIAKTAGNAVLRIENSGTGNTSGIDFYRERQSGTGVQAAAIFVNSDNSINNGFLYIQSQTTGDQSGATSTLSAANGARMILRGGTGVISFENGAAESVRFDASGNVGIGVTNPGTKLDVTGSARNSLATTHSLLGGSGNVLVMSDNTGTLYSTSTASFISANSLNLWSGATGGNIWNANSGNVGIGTTNPQAPITGYKANGGATTTEVLRLSSNWTSTGAGALLRFTNTNASGANPNTGEYNIGGIAGIDDTGNWGGSLAFYTTATGTTGGSNLVERVRITSNGNVGVGITNPSNQFQVVGNLASYAGITSGVGIQGNSSGSGLITAVNSSPADPASGISNGANFGFNGSASNFYGMGLGAVRNSKYDIWSQTGVTNGGGYRWYIGTTEKMTMDYLGNVGVGTTAPGTKLDVSGSLRNSLATTFSLLGGSGNVILMSDNTGTLYSTSTASFISANSLNLWSGSTTGAIWNANSGNVGIGTTNPGSNLEIDGGGSAIAYSPSSSGATSPWSVDNGATLIVKSTASADNSASYLGLMSKTSGGQTGVSYIGNIAGTGSGTNIIGSAMTFGFRTSGASNYNERMRITSDGNVGIGTTNPGGKLDIHGTGTSTGVTFQTSDSAGSPHVSILDNGSIGIGTTNPGSSLEVDGTASIGLGTELVTGDTSSFTSSIGTWTRILGNGTFVSSSGKGLLTNTDGVYGYWNSTVGITVGKTYLLSVKLKNISGSTIVSFGDTVSAARISFTTSGTETTYTGTFVAGGTSFTIYNGSIQQVQIDDISLKEVGNLYVGSAGLIGVGTTAPGTKLDVSGSLRNSLATTFSLLGGSGNVILMSDNTGTLYSTSTASFISANSLNLWSGSTTGAIWNANSGNVGIGITNPTAYLNLKAGTAAAGTSPLKFTSGTLLTTPEAGAVEYDGSNLYLTNSSAVRDTLALATTTSRYVAVTSGGNGTDVGTWTKIATLNGGANTYDDFSLLLSINGNTGSPLTVMVSLTGRQNTSAAPAPSNLSARVITGSNMTGMIDSDAFKITNEGYGTDFVIWMRKTNGWGRYNIYELSKYFVGNITYFSNQGWSTTTPTGTYSVASSMYELGPMGIGTASPSQKFEVKGSAGGYPATSGTVQNGIFRLSQGSSNTVLDMGIAGSSPNSGWLQTTNSGGLGTNYPLLLNPNGGNVGIGTTNPGVTLDVSGSLRDSLATTFSLLAGAGNVIVMADNTGTLYSTSTAAFISNNSLNLWSGSTTGAIWSANAGNVGIGTTNPKDKLTINGGGMFLDFSTGGATSGASWWLSSNANQAFIGSNQYYSTTDKYARNGGASRIALDQTTGSTAGNINFLTAPSGTADGSISWTNAMTIQQGGNVGIGTTNPAAKLQVYTSTGLGGTTGNSQILSTFSGLAGTGNTFMHNEWLYRDASGSSWTTTQLFDGISVDSSFLTPGTDTKTWWARDPNNNVQSWGNAANTYLTINGGNVGIGTTNPGVTLDVTGSFRNTLATTHSLLGGSGNVLVMADNTGTLYSTSTASFISNNGLGLWGGTTGGNIWSLNSGNVGIGTTAPGAFRLKVAGDMAVTGTLSTQTGSDFAEEFAVAKPIEPGTVVVMGDLGYKSVKPCANSYDKTVVGVVSDNPSIVAGRSTGTSSQKVIVAMVGVVSVKVTAANGSIAKGDLLTSSSVTGYAMKAADNKEGTIIGKALEDLSGRRGEIKVLVNLQ